MSQADTATPVTLDVVGLSKVLPLSEATIRADVSRRPWTLPPFIKVGTKTVWLYTTVMDWLKSKEQSATPPSVPEQKERRRRGRPPKAEQKRKQVQGGM